MYISKFARITKCSPFAPRLFNTIRKQSTAPKHQDLTSILTNVIKTTGPISLSSYIRQCLVNPEYGYYTTRDPLDAKKGDFITSPEISSTFGEICGLWFFSTFLNQLKHLAHKDTQSVHIESRVFRFIEFGPGKGTLMYDMLRVLQKFVKQNNPIEVVLVEKSDILIQEQYKKLISGQDTNSPLTRIDDYTFMTKTQSGVKITWLKDDKINIELDPKYINFVMAHEFYDALPINRYINTEKGWREYMVDINHDTEIAKSDVILPNVTTYKSESTREKVSPFHLVIPPYATPSSSIPNLLGPRYSLLPVNSVIELCPEAHDYITSQTKIMKSSNMGAGLIIDYGPESTIPIDSLRGIKDHKFTSPFDEPGEVDLSVDVDFGNLSSLLAEDNLISYVREQADWLNEMGLGYRVDQICSHLNDEKDKKKVVDAYKRLTSKNIGGMGKVYKVLGFFDKRFQEEKKPPGFEETKRDSIERN